MQVKTPIAVLNRIRKWQEQLIVLLLRQVVLILSEITIIITREKS